MQEEPADDEQTTGEHSRRTQNNREENINKMLTLTKKLRRESESSSSQQPTTEPNNNNNNQNNNNNNNKNIVQFNKKKISIRDRLLVKELADLESLLPSTCKLKFPDADKLHDFLLEISPDEGYWTAGTFLFHVVVTEEYNFAPPLVRCKTRLWHPNINEDGAVCLSLLRQSSIDELGWAPTRTLKDVVWGLNSLFTDLLNFDDPLNLEASDQFQRDISSFQNKVKEYIRKYT